MSHESYPCAVAMAALGGDYTPAALGNLWYLSTDPDLATFVGGACHAASAQASFA